MTPYKIGIERLKARVSVGIYGFEKKKKQDLFISAKLSFSDSQIHRDAMENSVDYDKLSDEIRHVCAARHYELIENLALHLGEALKKMSSADSVEIRIDKPLAAKKNNAETIYVTVAR